MASARTASTDFSPPGAGPPTVACAQTPYAWTSQSSPPTKGCGTGKGFCHKYGPPGATAAYGFDNVWACTPSTTIDNTPFDENDGNSFQCVDLSDRFIWAVYGLYAGPGDTYYGQGVVSSIFSKYAPKISEATTAGRNVPAPGDVISFTNGPAVTGPPVGHTAVVVRSNPKKGTFTIMSENMSSDDSDGTAGLQYLQTVPGSGKQVTKTTKVKGNTVTYTEVTQEGLVDFLDFGSDAYAEWLVPHTPVTGPSAATEAPLAITTPDTPLSPPNAAVGQPYGFDLGATGPDNLAALYHKQDKQLYYWSLVSGGLPPGLSLTSSGAIFGTPTAASRGAPFTVKVSAGGQTAEQSYSIWANAPSPSSSALTITTPSTVASPRNSIVGDPYSFTFQASGGSGGYRWSITNGSLPNGLSLSANGVVAGTPTKTSLGKPFTAQVSSGAATAAATFTIWALPASPLAITTPDTASTPPNAQVGVSYSYSLTATGGNGDYAWSLVGAKTGGGLPAGLALSAAGVISGTASQLGSGGTFTVQVASGGSVVSKDFDIVAVAAPPPGPLAVTTVSDAASPPNAKEGLPYAFVFKARGGEGPYQWSLANGHLPPGLALSSDGVISGTPTAVSKLGPFTLQVTDGLSNRATKRFTLWAAAGPAQAADLSDLLHRPLLAVPAHDLAPAQTTYYDATCPSAERCYVVGVDAGKGVVTTTSDAGRSWSTQTIGGSSQLVAISCPAARTCYVGGGSTNPQMFGTTDGGGEWSTETVPIGAAIDSIGCASLSDCLAVGNQSPTRQGSVIATQNGGISWTSGNAPGSGLVAVRCVDKSHCWASGGGAWFTGNLGATWKDESPPQPGSTPNGPPVGFGGYSEITDVEFQSPTDGWVVGGNQCGGEGATQCPGIAYHTTNGGATWTLSRASRSLPFGWQIACQGVVCLMVDQASYYSEIVYTPNDGRSWVKLKRVPPEIFALACNPGRTFCVAAGGNGRSPALLTLG
ncbi:MAG: putative Ig domain-containing protein [Candidatus Dormibacteria bacterium]